MKKRSGFSLVKVLLGVLILCAAFAGAEYYRSHRGQEVPPVQTVQQGGALTEKDVREMLGSEPSEEAKAVTAGRIGEMTEPAKKFFLSQLAAWAQQPYTADAKQGEDIYYDDKGSPIWPPNDGAVWKSEKTVTLQANTVISRYGSPRGRFVAPDATSIEERAMARTTDLKNFHRYKVLEDIENVSSGVTMPWFDKKGGGLQFLLPDSVQNLIGKKMLEEIAGE
ncbi:MAG: TNT domain-containing protein [Pyramidobacter sp.]|nr:TNT domain-containing protein [Pyramidobacter sp.]